SLEHFWYETVDKKDYDENLWQIDTMANAAVVTDVATDPNCGLCLEEAVGKIQSIYVVFPIDGELHVGIGAVYSQYQFTKSIDERMTDEDWKNALDPWAVPWEDYTDPHREYEYHSPEWTMSYKANYEQ
ncbi:MAG: DUF3160 domain-containing protein, partial [Lachnospiraceae bacterium]|nr:DUF3160 domain-containing protein [Lachnospiraceae bacterium]